LLHRGLRSLLHLVQVFRLEVRVTPQHAPILVARYHRDLLDRKTGFKQSTSAFMTQIVKAQIIDIDSVARPVEGSSNGFRVVRKYATEAAREDPLLERDLPRIVAGRIEKGDDLMIAVLSSRVFAIADGNCSLRHIDIRPFDPANFGLAHCSRDCEANDSSER